ncbi:integral membrane sensor signal transduction histidine kinase [Desulfotomaculum nigrificans CO-1-SRB]|uniref:histidine kinase n=1 Tax=Desulfotomaculum nigrificans (strain DSM 14880 / VKM B-2319 / CO-1-SRB) TaxID=868595 RepID=F6B7S4_DESCC|nr:ATP-binding protein [Desulfotomaculum nigrificans]AEF93446.1 integral membrane sensor signal transduction histidine kinase [Desulfotomaculum nigrificans CO-1-SRB]
MISLKSGKIIQFFKGKSLTNQIVIIIAAIMLVPLVALVYDIFFASKTDQVIFLDKEQRLESLVKSTNDEFIKKLTDLDKGQMPITPTVLHSTFSQVVAPHVPANSGIRFGLYVPKSDKITVLGFLHNYRNLSPTEEAERERDIFEKTKTGLVATEMSKEPLFRIAGTSDDQVVEYILPVIYQGKVVAVMWAGERLNPFFTQSSYFRKALRYFILAILGVAIIGTLLTVRNLINGVERLKLGLEKMEKDIGQLLPEMPGELGQVAIAVNKMALSLAEKEKLEDQLRRSEHLIALGRLATGVAHELRNPIGIIKTLVEIMKEEYSQLSGIDEFTRAVEEQVDRQNMVIQELLDFGRPTKVASKECSVNDLLNGVLSFSAAVLRKQKIKVRLNLQPDLPSIFADVDKLKQVFVNLIINASEAMPNGGILEIKSYNVDNQLVVQFVDTGEGIPPEEQSRIFDPFYTTKPTGTGLGLSISYQNIKLHNGTIEVDSSPGQGTTFTIKLPIEQNTPKGGEVVDTARISD